MAKPAQQKSIIPLILLLLLCTATITAASLWAVLRHGIMLENIRLPAFALERFSLQLDDGLHLAADRFDIFAPPPATQTVVDPGVYISGFNRWAHLFNEIEIKRIYFQNREYQLLFKNNRFTLSGDNFQLVSTLTYDDGTVKSEISRLEIKPYQVTLSGNGTYSRQSGQLHFTGSFNTPEVRGSLAVTRTQDQVVTDISTERFTNLDTLLARLPLDRELTTWIQENITALDYKIERFQVTVPLRHGKPDLDAMVMTGSATAREAAVRFEQSLPPVRCRNVHLALADDSLSFALDDPTYRSRSIDGSSVTIDHLTADVSKMDIFIQTDTPLDNDILELLQDYEVSLPFSQREGITHGELHLVFDIPDFSFRVTGTFSTGKGSWQWGDLSFTAEKAEVTLRDSLVTIQDAQISYGDVAAAGIRGKVDARKGVANLNVDIDHFTFRDGEKEIVSMHNLTTPMQVLFNDIETDILAPQLRSKITFGPSGNLLSLEDVTAISQYIPPLESFSLLGGNASIDFSNPSDLNFSGEFNTTELPLMLAEQPVTHYTFTGSKTGEQLSLEMNDDTISIMVTDKIDVRLTDYQVVIDAASQSSRTVPLTSVPLFISGPSSLIKTEIISIPTHDFQAEVNGSAVTFSAGLDQGQILYTSNNKAMTLAASDIDAQLARDFFKYADLEGGRFSFSLNGKDIKNCDGVVTFSNVLIKDMALINNILAFMNTIPALATLSSPGFDADGYHVNEGVAKFTLRNKLLTLEQVRTDGKAINTEMEGWVDFNNDTMRLNVELISLKDFSKIINLIPLAGYAILGENGSLSTSLLISGNRLDPDITTNLTSEIVMMPLNIIKRTIVWPFRVIDKIIEPFQDSPEPEK